MEAISRVCELCILGKHSRNPFPHASSWRAQRSLKLVHNDLWGLAQWKSMGGSRYFLSLIDDFSRRCWLYFLKHKSEALEVFKEWKAQVENEANERIKRLRTDRGGEFNSDLFD